MQAFRDRSHTRVSDVSILPKDARCSTCVISTTAALASATGCPLTIRESRSLALALLVHFPPPRGHPPQPPAAHHSYISCPVFLFWQIIPQHGAHRACDISIGRSYPLEWSTQRATRCDTRGEADTRVRRGRGSGQTSRRLAGEPLAPSLPPIPSPSMVTNPVIAIGRVPSCRGELLFAAPSPRFV